MSIRDNRGYTLPELIVVMAIFLVVIMITSKGFNTAATQLGHLNKQTETQMESIVGLEALRSDLQGAGYGLPWEIKTPPGAGKYTEITASANTDSTMPFAATFWPSGMSPTSFNDAPNVPRAVQSADTKFNLDGGVGSKYLVLKSLLLVPGPVPKKWATVSYNEMGTAVQPTIYNDPNRDFSFTDRVMVMRNTFVDGVPSRQLQVDTNNGGSYSTRYKPPSGYGGYSTLMHPHSSGDVFQVYGVWDGDTTVTDLRMPFNRADYYVATPAKMPPMCAPNTGILYKAYASQKPNTPYTEVPLLDCVADMQVVYGHGPVGSDECNFRDVVLPGSGTAKDIRDRLKEIRVYILAHEGKRDPSFTFPSPTIDVGENFGGLKGRTFRLSSLIGTDPEEYKHYRWKVYTIVVRPKNLIR